MRRLLSVHLPSQTLRRQFVDRCPLPSRADHFPKPGYACGKRGLHSLQNRITILRPVPLLRRSRSKLVHRFFRDTVYKPNCISVSSLINHRTPRYTSAPQYFTTLSSAMFGTVHPYFRQTKQRTCCDIKEVKHYTSVTLQRAGV